MPEYSELIIESAANRILSTRDFCGRELDAVKDFCDDNNIPFSLNFYNKAQIKANEVWNQCRRAAGVVKA